MKIGVRSTKRKQLIANRCFVIDKASVFLLYRKVLGLNIGSKKACPSFWACKKDEYNQTKR